MIGRFTQRQPAASTGVAFTALFLAVAGAAYGAASATPSHGGVIRGCYQKHGGDLRVLATGKRCHRGEKALAFNQTGPQGARGAQGSRGPQGHPGNQGPAGPLMTMLPSGETLRGTCDIETQASANAQSFGGSISFGLSLPSAPTVQIIAPHGPPTTHCSGSVTSPTAARGYLCLYEEVNINDQVFTTCDLSGSCAAKAEPFGAALLAQSGGSGVISVLGSWAVTAP